MNKSAEKTNLSKRPPVVVIVGHVDHGKSTLLDYIRKTNVVLGEAGGITQRITAYEVVHVGKDGTSERVTFVDTPGHAAFKEMRLRGAALADIAILIVSAEEGVKPQTVEALNALRTHKVPFVVAINKIDRPNANKEKVIQQLAEKEVYAEGYGGQIPIAAISAKTGEGIPDLLDLILLVAEMESFTGDSSATAEGFVVESHRDPKKGVTATLIIKNGSLDNSMYIVAGGAFAPLNRLEDFNEKPSTAATFSSPIIVRGWKDAPPVGSSFKVFRDRKSADRYAEETAPKSVLRGIKERGEQTAEEIHQVSLIVKADTTGMLEAVLAEIARRDVSGVKIKMVHSGIGSIAESDIKRLVRGEDSIIIGFNVPLEAVVREYAVRLSVPIKTFDIIYKLSEWLEEELVKRKPKKKVEKIVGSAVIVRVFSRTKSEQIVGGRVKEGALKPGIAVRIVRRGAVIEVGRLAGLQHQKIKVKEVAENQEFGAMVEAKHDIAQGDTIEAFVVEEQ